MNPIIAAAAINAASNIFGNLLSSNSALEDNLELMEKQFEYSKGLMNYQHELNSPVEYLNQLKAAGISPALMLSKGANQVQTSLGSTPNGDLSGIAQAKAINSQLLLQASQAALNFAQAKKTEKEAGKVEAETEGILTDNEFKTLLNQGKLDLMDSEVRDNLANANLNDAKVSEVNAHYNMLVKQLDEIDVHMDEMRANAANMNEMTALTKLEQELRKKLAESQIRVDNAQIKNYAAMSYKAIKEGDSAQMDILCKQVQKDIYEQERTIKTYEASQTESMQHEKLEQEKSNTRAARARATIAELDQARVEAGQEVATDKALAGAAEVVGVVGRVFNAKVISK